VLALLSLLVSRGIPNEVPLPRPKGTRTAGQST
jgi:hypothetical protein